MRVERAGRTVMSVQLGRRPPLLLIYRIATDIVPRWGFVKNVYQEVLTPNGVGVTIGVALNLHHWCLSLVRRKP